ncbi:TauD/TfdA family dioxygenase [Streptomyces albofaciens JCM 4342]|uniref:TauD/TfdA dioxygenase family protein n=1 Tax=Streptomyces albofaciens TaxID=66866 RepID=UPI001239FAF9|nr:TauD/TfdA family dioxygenase [Streptomyces albofaciens]KAA6214292.1 TauD/TfdA family dioxygenase [Streptomyces albofaciens JCM 4342]
MNGAFGAEITGVDLAALDDAAFTALAGILRDRHVLCIRGQAHLSPAQFLGFARRFGTVTPYPFGEPMEGLPEILRIIKEPESRGNFGGVWHTDSPYHEIPPSHTVIMGIDIPESGGDTLVADMTAAYEALPQDVKSRIQGLDGVFTATKVHGSAAAGLELGDVTRVADRTRADQEFRHPLVRVHPETGLPTLYVSACHMSGVAGLPRDAAQPLIDFLAGHVVREEFTARIRWTRGTVVVLDNRCVQHKALNDYPGLRREIHRVQITDGCRPTRRGQETP